MCAKQKYQAMLDTSYVEIDRFVLGEQTIMELKLTVKNVWNRIKIKYVECSLSGESELVLSAIK